MYNLRFTYSNPNNYDRRLSLFADGAGLRNPEQQRIPLWLPPTGEGKWATATLMWTLYDGTTWLRLECIRKSEKEKEPSPGANDTADVLISSVELVRSEPLSFTQPEPSVYPELVKIPCGAFTMGNKAGTEGDEMPAHEVKVSEFHLGKFEVTNAEFDRYKPDHRKLRDGFSWRDREPVIYVSWVDAVGYCNWLSKQANLKPVYENKEFEEQTVTKNAKGEEQTNVRKYRQWVIDQGSDGFRLPTEAEWEYAATGRGENRTYPWGSEAPIPMVHGHFLGQAANDVPVIMQSQTAQGTVVVGSFPKGASRDGVMDLAGNVTEWCSDWYQLYSEAAQTDPLELRESHSRSARGGSWGWYCLSQRGNDREFQNPGYGGYVYIGFRVALSTSGYLKLSGK